MFISLKDNQYNNTVPWDKAWKDYDVNKKIVGVDSSDYPIYDDYKKTLKKYNRVSLTELANPKNKEEYGKFLVFPSNAAESDLDTKDKVLFELLEENTENPNEDKTPVGSLYIKLKYSCGSTDIENGVFTGLAIT